MSPESPRACPLCGAALDGAQACRPSCRRAEQCGVICCPRCGYAFPNEEVGIAGLLRRFFQRRRGR